MIQQIPLDKFCENLETRNLIWISSDGKRSATEMFHQKILKQYTQIEKMSSSENEYLDALKNINKYMHINHQPESLLRLHMFSSDLIVSTSHQKQYKLLFLVDYFNTDLKAYLEKRKEEKNYFSLRDLFNCYNQIAESVLVSFEIKEQEKSVEISRVNINNFVLNVIYQGIFPTLKFIHIPFLAIKDDEQLTTQEYMRQQQQQQKVMNHLSKFKQTHTKQYSLSPQHSYNGSNANGNQNFGNYSQSINNSLNGSNINSTNTSIPSNSSQFSSKRGSLLNSLHQVSSSHTPVHARNHIGSQRTGYHQNKASNEDEKSTMSQQQQRNASPSNKEYSAKEKCQQLEQQLVLDMGEIFVRIANLSVEQWENDEQIQDQIQKQQPSKLKKGIRQIQIKYSQQLGNLIQSMMSPNQNERPPLSKIQSILCSIEKEASLNQLDLQSQKHVKFEPKVEPVVQNNTQNVLKKININDVNNFQEKNKLISLSPVDQKSLVLIDLNDTKHIYLEKIELENDINSIEDYTNPEGCKCTNILYENQYQIFIMGGNKSLNTHKYMRYSNSLVECAKMLGKTSRHSFGICSIYTDIYVIGGCDGEIITNQCERYDTRTNSWKRLSPLLTPVKNASVCVFNNQLIFKFGGILYDKSLCQTIEKYDTTTDTWTPVKYQIEPQARENFQILINCLPVQINEMQIIVFGGDRGTKDPQNQAKQSFFLNIYSNAGQSVYEVSELNTFATLPDSTPLYYDQFSINSNELLFLQMKNKNNSAKVISFSWPGGLKVLRSDLKW
ncbi:hypothetical protein ABPG74_009593 [Tetrahymena malaccensis]